MKWPLMVAAALLLVSSANAHGFESWVERRDRGVVRQQYDYSCGLAALATLLTYHWQVTTSERELLSDLEDLSATATELARQGGVSFADLASLSAGRGFRAGGYHATVRQLPVITGPFIVRLQLEGRSHFSVVTAISAQGHVQLADPSWGRRYLSSWHFERLFIDRNAGRGRVLVLRSDGGDHHATGPQMAAADREPPRLLMAPAMP